jgi:phosphomannomutase/phosphoglucomutase
VGKAIPTEAKNQLNRGVFKMGIFKPCDIRGIYDEELTDHDAYDLGRSAGTLIRGETALVAGDIRLSTPALKAALCDGLVSTGCQVADAGILTTPAFYYAVHRTGSAVGIMVTASHNPPEYNGFKLLFGGRPVNQEEMTRLQQTMSEKDFITGMGNYRQDDTWLHAYREHVIRHFRPGKLKIVLDCGNGACSLIAPEILSSLDYQVVELYCTPDGRFPNRSPNPALPENIQALCRRVIEEGAALGIAYDGDGDRVAFVDESGQPVANDRMLALFARRLLTRQQGVVVYDSKCSLVVAEEVARLGGTAVMARSGHTFVEAKFLESGALLAGELSGHFFWRDLGFDDGVWSSLELLELLQDSGVSLSQLDRLLPRYLITPDIRLHFKGGSDEVIETVAGRLSGYPVDRLDGLRLEFDDCWGMVRPSVTEPIITFRFEGKSEERLRYVIDLVLSVLPDGIRSELATTLPG